MARLNEPPIAPQPSAETIEAVKRRFLRQNRELAKTNSTQSIRIRSLENDCSRLLAENLALREQVLSLHNKIESRPGLDHIDAVKTQLEAKLQELGGLVAGLAQMKHGNQQDKERRKSQMTAKRRSGEERQWRSGLGLQEVENAMLPTITEDKYYPRRTMGADELDQVLEGPEGHSPDIGPPPVSRFESEDPIGFDPSPIAEEPQEETGEDGEPSLSVNLETRKKRRESGPKLSIRRVSLFEPPEETEETVAKSIRTSAKRKFSVQEDEDVNQSKSDAFRFSRRNAPSASETQASNEDPRPTSPHRPVLSSKPVNTDPVLSPKKQRSSLQAKPEKPEKPASKPRSRPRLNITRNAAPELAPPPMPEPIPTADIVLDSLPPKTPAVEAVFSPPSTEPSTQRPDNKDTPPPGDLTSSDQTGQAGRPGRRARPQVSYKEPSLNVKMRRPDAKLVDAVVDRRTSVDTQNPPSTAVKRDPNGEIAWKPVSAVPGRGGEEEAEVGSPLRQKLDRRDQDSKTSPPSTETEERSTTSRAISALITETSTAKRRVTTSTKPTLESGAPSQDLPVLSKDTIVVQQEAPKDNLAVFDFTDSPVDTATNPRNRALEAAKAARAARRHSAMSIPNASSSVSEERKVEREKTEGALPSLHKRTGSGNVKSTSTTSFGKSINTNGTARSTSSARSTSVKDKRNPSGEELSTSASADLRAKVDGAEETKARERETIAMRAERAASRRKSMLL